jgi:catechol 2,3-dioxygenase-like lactoylglutathione lyase family enzyme
MLDHIGIKVSDIDRAKTFYHHALAPRGVGLIMEWDSHAGFGSHGKPYFWIGEVDHVPRGAGVHVAFAAQTRAEVDAFYAAAVRAGGRDNGEPGLRPHYHAHYYGAFVLDADGNNIEAVCHKG